MKITKKLGHWVTWLLFVIFVEKLTKEQLFKLHSRAG